MKPKFRLSPNLYAQLLERLNAVQLTDSLGQHSDLSVFERDLWLCDAAVVDRVVRRKGLWDIVLVFVDNTLPHKFLVRRITAHTNHKRAEHTAWLMRRQAAKDQRGTIEVSFRYFSNSIN